MTATRILALLAALASGVAIAGLWLGDPTTFGLAMAGAALAVIAADVTRICTTNQPEEHSNARLQPTPAIRNLQDVQR